MDEKTLLTGVLTKTLSMTDEEVSDLLYNKAEDSEDLILDEDALDLVLDKNAKHIDAVKNSVKPDKKRLDNEYGRGAKETMDRFEQELKLKFGVESDAKGLDLVQATVDTVAECNTEITDENVKKHPVYRALEENSVPKKDFDTKSQELDEWKSNQDKTQRIGRVKSDVLSIVNNLKPIISENAVVAQTRQRDLLAKFEDFDYELAENGNHLILVNGGRKEDSHGHPVTFADFVKEIASTCYEFQVGQQAGQAANKNLPGAGSQHVSVPKTKEEYLKQMNELMLKGDKPGTIALKKAWEESQK